MLNSQLSRCRSTKTLVVYSREGCHLCEDLLHDLRSFKEFQSLPLQVVDIDKDAELMKQYNEDVPVLVYGEQLVCKHFLDPQTLREVVSRG